MQPTLILNFLAKTQKNDSHFSLKGILTSKLILIFHFKIYSHFSCTVISGLSSCAFWFAISACTLSPCSVPRGGVTTHFAHPPLPLICIYFFKGCNLVLNFQLSKSFSLSLSFSISVLKAKILILIFHSMRMPIFAILNLF